MTNKKPINDPRLGGNVVDKLKLPQRKTNKSMTGAQLLNKAVYGTHKPLTDQEKRNLEWDTILKK